MHSKLLGCLLLPALMAGCAGDPFERPGTWRPTGANAVNLRGAVEDPAHLQRGTGQQTEWGALAAPPIARLVAGERPPLPATGTASRIGTSTR